jgi:hypothetical protein
MRRLIVLVGTRKGLFVLSSTDNRRSWSIEGPHFLGQIVNHALVDPRDGRTIVAAVRAGHLGPTVYRSSDLGASWQEAKRPPAFARREGGQSVSHVFWLTPGAASQPGRWYAGTSPQGLFVSDDGRQRVARRGRLQRASRSHHRGSAACRTRRPMAGPCIRSTSIRAIPRTSTSACPRAACSNRATRASRGRR